MSTLLDRPSCLSSARSPLVPVRLAGWGRWAQDRCGKPAACWKCSRVEEGGCRAESGSRNRPAVRARGGVPAEPTARGSPSRIRFMIPLADRTWKVTLRTVTMPIPSQQVITRDNVSIGFAAVAYFRRVDAVKSIVEIEDVSSAIGQIAQTTVRNVAGRSLLDQVLTDTETLNERIRETLDGLTQRWVGDPRPTGGAQGHRTADHRAAGDGPAGGGRAREARQDHRRPRARPSPPTASPRPPTSSPTTRSPPNCATCRSLPRSPPRRTPPSSSPPSFSKAQGPCPASSSRNADPPQPPRPRQPYRP